MADDLDALLDGFDKPSTALHSTVQQSAVPLEHAPTPEPAEPWHNEPAPQPGPRAVPMTVTPVEVAKPEIVYRPDAPKPKRKTPDEMNWRECWLRIGKLYAREIMDPAQYHDLIEASSGWRASGLDKPPTELLEKVRMALWAFDSEDEERDSGRARNSARHRRVDTGAGRIDQRLREHDAAG